MKAYHVLENELMYTPLFCNYQKKILSVSITGHVGHVALENVSKTRFFYSNTL